MGKPLWMWVLFFFIIISLLIADLGLFNREKKDINLSKSLKLSIFYIAIAIFFGVFVWQFMGTKSALEYYTGFIIEKILALDNIFAIIMIFEFLKVPSKYQHRVLFWGILGVIVMRALMIGLGINFVENFAWALDLFAIILIATGIKFLLLIDKEVSIKDNIFFKFLTKYLPITKKLHGEKFIVKLPFPNNPHKTRYYITPLFLSLIMIELVDLIFAIDSLPAIFMITQEPYIIYTSNIFAILGLRALYFSLNAVIARFKYLKHSMAVILIFIGSKMFIAKFLGLEKFPVGWSLSITFSIICVGIIYSIIDENKRNKIDS